MLGSIFMAMGPGRVKQLVANIAPLPCSTCPSCSGLDVWAVLSTLFALCGPLSFISVLLMPQTLMLVNARDALCGGNTQFV